LEGSPEPLKCIGLTVDLGIDTRKGQMDSVASLRTQDTVPRIWYSTIPKRVIHEPDHGKIGPDWKPVNWVQQGKIRG
jgi:hypothetical protein